MLKSLVQLPTRQWWLLLFVLTALVVGLDIWTKSLASTYLYYANPVPITSFFDLTLLHNFGAAFSFLSDKGGWQRWFFTGISIFASVAIVVWLIRLNGKERLLSLGLSFVLGGAVGNLIDRISLGYVVDFLSFHWRDWYFPAFNIADSAITLGAIILIFDMLFTHKEAGNDSTGQ